jgi:hypothetical protein
MPNAKESKRTNMNASAYMYGEPAQMQYGTGPLMKSGCGKRMGAKMNQKQHNAFKDNPELYEAIKKEHGPYKGNNEMKYNGVSMNHPANMRYAAEMNKPKPAMMVGGEGTGFKYKKLDAGPNEPTPSPINEGEATISKEKGRLKAFVQKVFNKKKDDMGNRGRGGQGPKPMHENKMPSTRKLGRASAIAAHNMSRLR